jgi:hypothetical protein
MIALPPYSRWREIKSLFSRAWNVIRYRGTADMSLSARAYLEVMPQRFSINEFYRSWADEDDHCRDWAWVETYRALDTIAMAEKRGILPSVKQAHQARKGGR